MSVGEDDYQETVGASRGKWAKELIEDAKKALMTEIKEVEHAEENKEKTEKKTEPGEFSDSLSQMHPACLFPSENPKHPLQLDILLSACFIFSQQPHRGQRERRKMYVCFHLSIPSSFFFSCFHYCFSDSLYA